MQHRQEANPAGPECRLGTGWEAWDSRFSELLSCSILLPLLYQIPFSSAGAVPPAGPPPPRPLTTLHFPWLLPVFPEHIPIRWSSHSHPPKM